MIVFFLFFCFDGYLNNFMFVIYFKNLVRRIIEGWVSLFGLSLVGSLLKYIGFLMINCVFLGFLIVDFYWLFIEIVVILLFFFNNIWCYVKLFKFFFILVVIVLDFVLWLYVNSNFFLDSLICKKFVCFMLFMYSSSVFVSIVLKWNLSFLVFEMFYFFIWRNEVWVFVSVFVEVWLSVNEI